MRRVGTSRDVLPSKYQKMSIPAPVNRQQQVKRSCGMRFRSVSGGDPSNTIRMLQEARKDGWLRGDIIGLIINNSQWIDDDTWLKVLGAVSLLSSFLSVK